MSIISTKSNLRKVEENADAIDSIASVSDNGAPYPNIDSIEHSFRISRKAFHASEIDLSWL